MDDQSATRNSRSHSVESLTAVAESAKQEVLLQPQVATTDRVRAAAFRHNSGVETHAVLITSRSQVQILSPQLYVSPADSRLCNPAKGPPERRNQTQLPVNSQVGG
jgi:hypothetical protein